MSQKVLIIGGAGFIGSYTAEALLARGYEVRVLDNLDSQVHGRRRRPPSYLHHEVEFVKGDIRDRSAVAKAIKGVDAIFYHASAVGVGQSMYEIRRYVEVNSLGCANLLESLAHLRHRVTKLVVASSMSLYGEGRYQCSTCGPISPQPRALDQFKKKVWEVLCPHCHQPAAPLPTDEEKALQPTSIYAITKRDQEEMALAIGKAYRLPTVALRYFNVYGPRQALSNPYTGVVAIFSSCLLNGHRPPVFEDGRQSRDFIHVEDIARANVLALEKEAANYGVFNVGTGVRTNLLQLLQILKGAVKPAKDVQPKILGRFREGDIRHCSADISRIRQLGFSPQVSLTEGLAGLAQWLTEQQAQDHSRPALQELRAKGLIK